MCGVKWLIKIWVVRILLLVSSSMLLLTFLQGETVGPEVSGAWSIAICPENCTLIYILLLSIIRRAESLPSSAVTVEIEIVVDVIGIICIEVAVSVMLVVWRRSCFSLGEGVGEGGRGGDVERYDGSGESGRETMVTTYHKI